LPRVRSAVKNPAQGKHRLILPEQGIEIAKDNPKEFVDMRGKEIELAQNVVDY
jgi:hypothetical protein